MRFSGRATPDRPTPAGPREVGRWRHRGRRWLAMLVLLGASLLVGATADPVVSAPRHEVTAIFTSPATPVLVRTPWGWGLIETTPEGSPSALPMTAPAATATTSPSALATPSPSQSAPASPTHRATPTSPPGSPPPSTGTPVPTPAPTPTPPPTPTPAPPMGRVDVSESAGGSNLSWSVLGSNLPWSTSLTTRAAYEGSVETDTSAYWSTLTFCYSIMPTDNGALDGLGADGCSVGPGSGDTFTATAVSASQDAPTWTLWIWTCTGTSGASMSGCLAYGKARDWILAGS